MKINTIKENRDFRRIYKNGKCFVSPVLVTYILKNKNNNLQVGITTGKKVGSAVRRNRARRVIRAAYANLCSEIKSGYSIVFVARSKTPFVKSGEVEKNMRSHFKKSGILLKQK